MSQKVKGLLFLLLLGAVWGSSFILMKLGMEPVKGFKVFSSTQLAGLRVLIAGLVVLPFAVGHLSILFSKTGLFLLIVGVCGNFIPSYLFTFASKEMSSGMSGILNSFTPVFTALLGYIAFKVPIHRLQILGIFIGIVGMVLLIMGSYGIKLGGGPLQYGAVLLATLLYGISVNTVKHKLQHLAPFQVTSLALMAVSPLSVFLFFWSDTPTTIIESPFSMNALFYVAILGIVGTALSNMLFNRLIHITSALFASSVTYLIPIFAIIFGYFFKEQTSAFQILSMAVILAGVFFINFHQTILNFWSNKAE